MKMAATAIITLLLFSCNSSDTVSKQSVKESSKNYSKDSSEILKFNRALHTGWYFVSDTLTGYKRQLFKFNESYSIEPTPIVTTVNFKEVSLFHEKDCWAVFTWLNKSGAQSLNIAKQKARGKKLAFILDDKLIRLQPVDDPQFASVEDDVDPRVYGEVLTFPCNSFPQDELKNFDTILKNESKIIPK